MLTAQVGASMYGAQLEEYKDIIEFVTTFDGPESPHRKLLYNLNRNRIPLHDDFEAWPSFDKDQMRPLLKFVIAGYVAPNVLLATED